MVKKQLIILDRDGIINELVDPYVRSVDELELIEDVPQALNLLLKYKFKISICSNQRGVSRGLLSLDTLYEIERRIITVADIEHHDIAFYYCTHDISDSCNCRKPKPGLLCQAINDVGCYASEALFIGDSISDCKSAQSIGVDFNLILTGHGKLTAQQPLGDSQIFVSLMACVRNIITTNFP